MVGDFAGGAMMLAFGMLAALRHAQRTGEGQVVDAAMTDGSALLMSMIRGLRAMGKWGDGRGGNLLDTAAPFYDAYETADGKWDVQMDPQTWRALKPDVAPTFKANRLDEWVALFAGHEACFAPVLDFDEALADPHNRARGTFVEAGGVPQPAPAPRYSARTTVVPLMHGTPDDAVVLRDLGFDEAEIATLGH